MSKLNWDKHSRHSRARSNGIETNSMLPGGQSSEQGIVDPVYKRKLATFEKIAKRVSKADRKSSTTKTVERKTKSFVVEVRNPKKADDKEHS